MLDITHSSIVRDYRNFYASTFDRNIPFAIPGRYNTNTRQFGKRNLGHDRYTPSSPPRLRIPQSVLTGCQYRDGELRRGRHCEANNLICADSRRKSSLRTLPRHTLSVFQQSQSRDLHVYWKAVPVARSPSRDERAPSRASPSSPSRFSTLSLSLSRSPYRYREKPLPLICRLFTARQIRAEKRNLPGISRFEGSPRAKQLDEIRHREEFYPASSRDPGLFALPRSL